MTYYAKALAEQSGAAAMKSCKELIGAARKSLRTIESERTDARTRCKEGRVGAPMHRLPLMASRLLFGLAAVLLLAASCGPLCQPIPCVPTDVVVTVTNASQGALAVSGVQATFTGPENGTMSCRDDDSASICSWGGVKSGKYSVQLTAPGFEPKTVSLTMTVNPPARCGCPSASVEPSTVSLQPAP